jgi:hypothetical protein
VPLVSIGEARGAAEGTHLRIRGVVTAPSGLLEAGSAVVQDGTAAILVRLGDKAGSLSLGQLVELDGTRSTKAGMLSLRVAKPPLRLGTQADPTPVRRATGALGEPDEALVVITRGKVSTAISRLRSGGISFSIDDGSGPVRVTIAPRSGIATRSIKRGAWLELRGVLGQETTSRAPRSGYRLWPRMRADLTVIAAPVAGGGTPCCAPSSPSPVAARLSHATEPGGMPGAGIPPILARPHPTLPATSAIPIAQATTASGAPREAGLLVSGLGLASLAGLAAWLGRRRRPGTDAPVEGEAAATPIPQLIPLRVEAEEPAEERRILPPT